MQVASGLAYLHSRRVVYYDLKSPNILVFQFPSVQESLAATQGQGYSATPTSEFSESELENLFLHTLGVPIEGWGHCVHFCI